MGAEEYLCNIQPRYLTNNFSLWYIVDRKKELIKVRYFQVAPPELEGVLLSHPGVADVAVVGFEVGSGQYKTEAPRAYVVLRAEHDKKVTPEEIYKFAAERLARCKRLEGGVIFVPEIPKTTSGKILKRQIRDRVRREGKL